MGWADSESEAGASPGSQNHGGVNHKLALATLLINGILLAATLDYSVNIPIRHPELCLGKELPYNLMGTGQCLESRNLLAGNQLHLGVWHGFQQVFCGPPIRLQSIRLRCLLEEEAYLNVILLRRAEGFSAIRISCSQSRPNLYFEARSSGEITRSSPLPLSRPGPGWHRLRVERQPGGWQVHLDDQQCRLESSADAEGLVGLWGGRRNVIVDDLEIKDTAGRTLRETFDGRRFFVRHLICGLGLLLSLDLIWWLNRRRAGLRTLALLRLSVFSGLLTYTLIDYGFWSHRYCAGGMSPFGENMKMDPLEWVRTSVMSAIDPHEIQPSVVAHQRLRNYLNISAGPKYSSSLNVFEAGRLTALQDSPEAIDAYLQARPETMETLLVLGTSQTHGSGATCYSDGMVGVLARSLDRRYPGRRFRVVNAARCGSQSSALLERTRSHLMKFRPKLLVLNLGTNDPSTEQLRSNLQAWAEIANAHSCRVACVLEANSLEKFYALEGNHRTMKEVARVHGWQVLDLYQHLGEAERQDRGMLWWDFVHPTDFGHQLAGQFLSTELKL